jgi:hypothetical protein
MPGPNFFPRPAGRINHAAGVMPHWPIGDSVPSRLITPRAPVTLDDGVRPENAFGWLAGDRCWRFGCSGILIEAGPYEGCMCWAGHAPCYVCMTPREECPVCDWRAQDDDRCWP